jgi:Tetracyclin repressor-like, C-terminal domain
VALAHPNVVPLLVTRPLATPLGQRPPGMLRPLADVLALLTSAGFTGDDALHIYRMLFGYLHGHVLDELQEIIERPDETDQVLRLGLHRFAVTEFPLLRALAPALALLRRRRRTRRVPRSAAAGPDRNPHPPRRITPNHLSPTRVASSANGAASLGRPAPPQPPGLTRRPAGRLPTTETHAMALHVGTDTPLLTPHPGTQPVANMTVHHDCESRVASFNCSYR